MVEYFLKNQQTVQNLSFYIKYIENNFTTHIVKLCSIYLI